jgi:hypothetical protein
MKNSGLLLSILLASICCLRAQVTVEVLTDQDQFLGGEAIPVAVRITNRSGQTLKLGRDETWLKFSIEARDGYVVLKNGDVPVAGEFTVESSERATVRVNLAPYFYFPKPGRYSITASVAIPEWEKQISSPPKAFDIIEGARIWEQDFGVPKAPGATNAFPEMRKFALQQANYLRGELRLYVQVTDSAGKFNKVFPIGPMLSFGRPEPVVDKFSNLHLLYQSGPHASSYFVVNPDGEIIKRQTYDFTPSRPRLTMDADGNFIVTGGTRRITRDDLPRPKSASNDSALPKP